MSAVDSLPGDQRAVLQLVLGRGRSYDEIARLLSIDPAGVRERALAALDALGPQTKADDASRAQIADYLLGQLPEAELDEVRDRLAREAADRAWARVVSSELAPLAAGPLPEIPLETSSARAAQRPPAPAPEAPAVPPVPPAPAAEPAGDGAAAGAPAPPTGRQSVFARRRRSKAARDAKPPPEAKPPREPKPPREAKPPRESKVASPAGSGPRSSRLGGLIVIAVVVAIVAVGLIVLLGGGSKKKQSTVASTPAASTTTPAASATTPAASATTSATTSGTSTAAKVVAQINLTPSIPGSKAAGIAEVLQEGATKGIAIVAQNVPPNTTHPPNAYAVWLYNSATDAKILGFVNPGVPKTGKLSTAGGLPTNAAHYKQLVVTVESSANPKTPGTIILQGTLTGV